MSNELAEKPTAELSTAIEQVVIEGDLSRLSPEQRVEYYRTVCQTMGLNPYTKPFDYLRLNNKLTLYARKDATDQLRKIHGVNIDDIKTDDDGDWFVVTVKGSDRFGRRDVEIGAVRKTDMQGNQGNAMMKAVTKAKRRLTLSLCGLGWLDETEVETIPNAQPVIVDDSGNIAGQARIDSKAVVIENPNTNTPKAEKPVETQEEPYDEVAYLKKWKHVPGLRPLTLEEASEYKTKKQKLFSTCSVQELAFMWRAYSKRFNDPLNSEEVKADAYDKMSAVNTLLTAKASAQEQLDEPKNPFIKGA